MARVLVWDLPTRLFHWLFTAGFIAAAFIALALGEHGPLFPFHSIIGLTLAAMVCLRIIWGLLGSRYARFGSFPFSPAKVVPYGKAVLTGKGERHVGHNPGSAYAAVAMMAIMLGLAATGIMMARGSEGAEEVHEFLAYSMLAVIGVHVLGVIVHSLQHRDNITVSMVHGRKPAEEGAGIPSSHRAAAAVFLLLVAAWAGGLLAGYDAAAQTTDLPLLGVRLQLGEAEGEGEHSHERRERDEWDDDD